MMKSKHFRKDVIIARVIFLALCVLLVVGIAWLVSKLTGTSKPDDSESKHTESQHTESQNTGYVDSESESDSESEKETISETNSESESETDQTPDIGTVVRYVEVTASKGLRLRTEPNTSCDTLAFLNKGEKAEILEFLDTWYKVSYKGQVGYLSSSYVKEVEEVQE